MLLRNKDKQALLEIVAQILPNSCEIWAYGSRVDGTAHDMSDLDLVIRTADLSPLPVEVLGKFKQALDDSNIPIIIQAVDWGRIPENFKENISINYEIIK